MKRISIALTALAVVFLAGCEDFQVTDHTVMDGQPPPEIVQIAERTLHRSEVVGRWKIGIRAYWPDASCALEVGSNGKFLWTSVDDLKCTFELGPMYGGGGPSEPQRLMTVSGTWRVDGAVAEGTVSYFDQRRQETVEIAVGGHLRLVRPGTYCVVGIRIAHLDLLLPENPIEVGPGNPGEPPQPTPEPDPDGRLRCFMVVQAIT